MIKEEYKIIPKITVRKGYNFNKNYIYILELKNKIDIVLEDLSINYESSSNIPKEFIKLYDYISQNSPITKNNIYSN